MSTPTDVLDLPSIHALAYKLYCQCQEQLEASKSITRSLRRLRNKLEEADEALDEAPIQHEDVRVLQAVGESRNVLNILDLALQHHHKASTDTQSEDFVSDFLTLIDSVTAKLSDALAALEGQTGTSGLLDASLPHRTFSPIFRSPSASTVASNDPRRNRSLASSPFSPRFGRLSMLTDNTSLGSEQESPDKNTADLFGVTTNRELDRISETASSAMEKHAGLFFDPMSTDIDQATSMILRQDSQRTWYRYHVVNPDSTEETNEDRPTSSDMEDKSIEPSSMHTLSSTFPPEPTQKLEIGSQQRSSRPALVERIVSGASSTPSRDSSPPPSTGWPLAGTTLEYSVENSTTGTARVSLRPSLSMSGMEVVQHRPKRYVPEHPDMKIETNTTQSAEVGLGITDLKDIAVGHADIDQRLEQRIATILKLWNDNRWEEAEKQIMNNLPRPLNCHSTLLNRKLRHLLGIIASLQGQWEQALLHFISVINAPITQPSQLDAGDCAAAYWLGDTYALLNRRVEALLAYSIAERSPMFQDPSRQRLHQSIRADQDACRAGDVTPDTRLWEQERLSAELEAGDSILDPRFVTGDAAKSFLSYVRWQPEPATEKPYTLDQNDGRAFSLWKVGLDAIPWQEMQRLKISPSALTPSGPWPLAFDPLFSMANVSAGRLIQNESDLYQLAASNQKISKSSGFGRKMDVFTHPDLAWLIHTIRKCLRQLEIEWTETSNAQHTFFAARYPATEDSISTINYFSISLFRLSFRSGYGVDICHGGLSSARITRKGEPNFDKGVHIQETKRVKKLIREVLEREARKQEEEAMQGVVLPVMSINGVTSLQRRGTTVKSKKKPASSNTSASPASLKSSRPGSVFSWRGGS